MTSQETPAPEDVPVESDPGPPADSDSTEDPEQVPADERALLTEDPDGDNPYDTDEDVRQEVLP